MILDMHNTLLGVKILEIECLEYLEIEMFEVQMIQKHHDRDSSCPNRQLIFFGHSLGLVYVNELTHHMFDQPMKRRTEDRRCLQEAGGQRQEVEKKGMEREIRKSWRQGWAFISFPGLIFESTTNWGLRQ